MNKINNVSTTTSAAQLKVSAKADTDASQHYFRSTDTPIIQQVQISQNNIDIQLPDSSTIKPTHVGCL